MESGPVPTVKQAVGQVEDICWEHDDQPGHNCVNHNIPCLKVEQEKWFQSFNDLLIIHVSLSNTSAVAANKAPNYTHCPGYIAPHHRQSSNYFSAATKCAVTPIHRGRELQHSGWWVTAQRMGQNKCRKCCRKFKKYFWANTKLLALSVDKPLHFRKFSFFSETSL